DPASTAKAAFPSCRDNHGSEVSVRRGGRNNRRGSLLQNVPQRRSPWSGPVAAPPLRVRSCIATESAYISLIQYISALAARYRAPGVFPVLSGTGSEPAHGPNAL